MRLLGARGFSAAMNQTHASSSTVKIKRILEIVGIVVVVLAGIAYHFLFGYIVVQYADPVHAQHRTQSAFGSIA